jgi:hypothetical protein
MTISQKTLLLLYNFNIQDLDIKEYLLKRDYLTCYRARNALQFKQLFFNKQEKLSSQKIAFGVLNQDNIKDLRERVATFFLRPFL